MPTPHDITAENFTTDPQEAIVFDAQEFEYLCNIAFAAATLVMPVKNPGRVGFNLVEDDGEVTSYRFTDRPENRALLAVKKELNNDSRRFSSFAWRYMALMDLLRRRLIPAPLTTLSQGHPESMLIHTSVFEVAAAQTLSRKGAFQTKRFIQTLKAAHSSMELDHAH